MVGLFELSGKRFCRLSLILSPSVCTPAGEGKVTIFRTGCAVSISRISWTGMLARRRWMLPILFLTLMLTVLACSGAAPSETADRVQEASTDAGKLKVVTTLNIVADWVVTVGGERVAVTALLPADADPHNYKPGAQDVATVADADLVITVGQGLEDQWVNDLVANVAKGSDSIVALDQYVDLLEYEEDQAQGHDHQHGHDHGHGPLDPHFWFDPLRVKDAVHGIAESLASADPAGRSQYEVNSAAYVVELDSLHSWIEEQVEALPAERRLLVSSHDSLRYFAKRYGFKVVGAVKPPSGQEEPSAQELTELADQIKAEGVPAIFSEDAFSPRLSQRIAEETGVQMVSTLRTSSLGEPGSAAGTYLGFMRHNVSVMMEALN